MFVEARSTTAQPWGLFPLGAQHQSVHPAPHGTVTALHGTEGNSTERYDTARQCTHSLWLASLLSCSISDLCPQVSQCGLCCDVSSNNVPLSMGYCHICKSEGGLPSLLWRKGHRIQVHPSGKYYVGHILLSNSIFHHWDDPCLCKRQELWWHRLWASSR